MSIRVTFDSASPMMARITTAAKQQGLALVGARAGGQMVRDHLFALNTERHRYGRNYYAQAARSVTVNPLGETGATIGVTQVGIRLRYYGGTVRAGKGKSSATGKPTRYLAIPAREEAYGMRPSEFHDLSFELVETGNGGVRPALVRRLSTPIRFVRRKQKDGSIKTSVKAGEVRGGEVMFWLVRKTTHRADPTVLPTMLDLMGRVISAMNERIDRAAAGKAEEQA